MDLNQEEQQHSLDEPLLGSRGETAMIFFNKRRNELDEVYHFSSFCTQNRPEHDHFESNCCMSEDDDDDDDDDDSSFQDEECGPTDKDDREIRQNEEKNNGTTCRSRSSCCCRCYLIIHGCVSWILLSLLLTSQWTLFVFYPKVLVQRNMINNIPYTYRADERATTVTIKKTLSVLQSMQEKELATVAVAFWLYLLALGILGWVGIRLYHHYYLSKQQQQQRCGCKTTSSHHQHQQSKNSEMRSTPFQQQQQLYLRISAISILMILNLALVLLFIDERVLALVAMIACLVVLLWSFTLLCLDGYRLQDNNNKDLITTEQEQLTTTLGSSIV